MTNLNQNKTPSQDRQNKSVRMCTTTRLAKKKSIFPFVNKQKPISSLRYIQSYTGLLDWEHSVPHSWPLFSDAPLIWCRSSPPSILYPYRRPVYIYTRCVRIYLCLAKRRERKRPHRLPLFRCFTSFSANRREEWMNPGGRCFVIMQECGIMSYAYRHIFKYVTS